MSNTFKKAQLFLLKLESAAVQVELYLNEIKNNPCLLKRPDKLNQVEDILYLGSWLDSTQKDIDVRIVTVWTALIKMNKTMKMQLFRSRAETVLLYWSSNWT